MIGKIQLMIRKNIYAKRSEKGRQASDLLADKACLPILRVHRQAQLAGQHGAVHEPHRALEHAAGHRRNALLRGNEGGAAERAENGRAVRRLEDGLVVALPVPEGLQGEDRRAAKPAENPP